MTSKHQHDEVKSRDEPFVEKMATRIWQEIPSVTNPYIAERALCHGYDLMDLAREKSFVEVFFLLFKGGLPSPEDRELLEMLMIFLINPGPRHPATRAAMNAGVGKTRPSHILPIATSLLGGNHSGGDMLERSMRFFRKNQKVEPVQVVSGLIESNIKGEPHWEECLPGFGRTYGGIDTLSQTAVSTLLALKGAGSALKWGNQLNNVIKTENVGWLSYGVAAAVFADLGFHPRSGVCLYQLMCAPGLVAHGVELANKPITAMPYVRDEDYVIER